jgi:DNA-binding transcriptional LysR family regulator
MDQLKAIGCFVAVAEAGSFAAAAQKLGHSKALVSKQVAALEAHLGSRLIQRTTRRLSLTESGRLYLEHSRNLLDQISAMEARIARTTVEPSGTLRVSAPLSFGRLFIAPLVAGFATAHPGLRLDLALNDRFVDLVEEGFDLAIRIGGALPGSLIARKLGTTRSGIFASPEYLAEKGRPRSPRDFDGHRCLAYGQGAAQRAWEFAGQPFQPDWQVKSSNGDLLRQVALDGGGLVSLPDFFVCADLEAGRLVALEEGWERESATIHALYPHRQYLPRKVRLFADYLAAELPREYGPGESRQVTVRSV